MRNLALFLLLAFIFTIPLENRVTGDFGSIAKWIGVLTFIVWFASALLTNRVRRPHLLHGLMALFTLWVGVSILWSVYDPATATRFQTYMQSVIMSYIMWDLLLKPYQVQWTLWALLSGCYVATIMVLHNFMTGPMFVAYDLRYTVVGFDPNDMGVMLALGIPIAWWLASETSGKSPSVWLRGLCYLYIPAATFSVTLTASRTALLALIPAYLYVIASALRLNWFTRIAIPVALVASAVFLMPYIPQTSIDRLAQLDESVSQGDLTGRGEIWEQGLVVLKEHPLLGVGAGAFSQTIERHQPAHNLVIAVTTETGIIGMLIYGAIILLSFANIFRQEGREKYLWLTLFLVWTTGAISLNWEYRKQTWLLFTLIVASANTQRSIIDGIIRPGSMWSLQDDRGPQSEPSLPSRST